MAGISAEHWAEVWGDNDYEVAGLGRRDAFRLSLYSLFTELVRRLELREFRDRIDRVEVRAPLLILGQWGSGTSHLHRLLSLDPQMTFPTNLQAFNPHTFLCLQGLSKKPWVNRAAQIYARWMARSLSLSQEVDWGSLEAPQEDEFALLAFGVSPMLGLFFPQRRAFYDHLYNPRMLSSDLRRCWQERWLQFLRKVAFQSPGRRLVLKSPGHTGRLELIEEVFPQARYVHIARHPYQMMQSARYRLAGLLSESGGRFESCPFEVMLSNHGWLYDGYFRARQNLGGRLHELRYEDLVKQPVAELDRLYLALELEGFDQARARVEPYLKEAHRGQLYPELSEADKARIQSRCARYMETFGYSP